ncbi:DUF899 family protein [Mycobacterium barrassiae]|nr:DUF899 family protein [Mycobacterium barrassiae]
MALPQIVPRDEWQAARDELLAEEKALMKARDDLGVPPRARMTQDVPAGRPQGPPYEWWRLHDNYR